MAIEILNKMQSLLICIAHQHDESRPSHLKTIIDRFKGYDMNVDIVIDTNKHFDLKMDDVDLYVHENLSHRYRLTWMHRWHFIEDIDYYDWFMYVEDDMDIPLENFKMYMENYKLMNTLSKYDDYKHNNYIPSFVRVEKLNNKEYNVDNLSPQMINLIKIGDKEFTTIGNSYHGFWIMAQKDLKESITDDFYNKTSISRETAASYPTWELRKTPLLMIENNQASPLCYSYHLSNNYVTSDSPFGKVEMKDLLYYKNDDEVIKDVIINKKYN